MIRKMCLFILMAGALLFIAGCGMKEKIDENITEGIIDSAIGEEGDIDIEDDSYTLTNEEGEEYTFESDGDNLHIEGEDGTVLDSGGDYEWPEDQAAVYIPKYDKGKLTYILNSDETCALMLAEMKIEDFEDYVDIVKDKGFTEDKFESSSEDGKTYSASTEDELIIFVYYYKSEGTLNITLDATAVQ